MTDQTKHGKSGGQEDIISIVDDDIDHSNSENSFDWDFILDREWSRTKK